jgi:esterase/lipase superfamily enzyme
LSHKHREGCSAARVALPGVGRTVAHVQQQPLLTVLLHSMGLHSSCSANVSFL